MVSECKLGPGPADDQRLLASAGNSPSEPDPGFARPHLRGLSVQKEMGNNGGPRPFIDEDQGDFHEAFVDISTGLDDERSVTLRLGQQELVYGTGRLVDNNEGVNVKSSFYGGRVIAKTRDFRLEVFGVKPTEENTGTFDDRPNSQQTFWGSYGTVPLPLVDRKGQVDLYYLGLDTTRATYEQGSGREIRHSLGARLFNHQPGAPFPPGLDYNWEFVYQLGSFGHNGISAWTVATETGYTFPVRFLPRLALRADIASGAQSTKGGPSILLIPCFPWGVFRPKADDVRTLQFSRCSSSADVDSATQCNLRFRLGWFWRQSLDDGIYGIGGPLLRPSGGSRARYIGSQANFELRWCLDAHTTIALNLAGLSPEDF